MGLELIVLGASSATPTSNTHTTAQLLKMREQYFLIDCGEGTQKQLRRAKVKFSRINHIFISHLHGDHFFGLVGLLSSFHLLGRTAPMHIYGPPKLKEIILGQFRAAGTFTTYPLHFIATQAETPEILVDEPTFTISSFPLDHRIPTTGFRFEEKPLKRGLRKEVADSYGIPVCDYHWIKEGRDWTDEAGKVVANSELTTDPERPLSYAFASDTQYSPQTADYVANVDLLYHESTFLEDHAQRAAETKHSTAKEASAVAKSAKARGLLLGHYSARYHGVQPFIEEAQTVFSPVWAARELWKYKISLRGLKAEPLINESDEK